MQLDRDLQIFFDTPNHISAPWALLLSAKPGSINNNSSSVVTFYDGTTRQFQTLRIRWNDGEVNYIVTGNTTVSSFPLDTTKLNHIAFERNGNKLCFWLNGEQKKTESIILGDVASIRIGVNELGILSLYNRNLNKQDIVQHFIDHHVENFTEDKVLI
jgi:hypothetical protein